MRFSTFVLAFLVIFILTTIITDGKKDRQFHITSLVIKFDKTDAIFTINYEFDKLSRTYLLIFGGKNIEPKIKYMFSNFDYDIIKIDQDKTILKVNNISRLSGDHYLHDSRKFGDTIEMVYIYAQDSSRPKEYYNISSTPYFFYRK